MPRLAPPRPLVAVVAALGLALAACGSDEDVTKQQFETDLVERTHDDEGDPTISEDQAACIADAIFAEYDQAEVNRIYRAATEDELGTERRDELVAINERCLTEPAG